MSQDVQPLLHEHLGVGKLVGMAEGKLAVLARLFENCGAKLRAELGPGAKAAVHPQFDVIGARGDGLIDFGARLLGRRHLRIGSEAIFDGRHARAAELAALLRVAHLNHLVRIGLHARRRGHSIKRILA